MKSSWIQGEDVETFPKDPFKMVRTWIINSGNRKVVRIIVDGGYGLGDGGHGIVVSGEREAGYRW